MSKSGPAACAHPADDVRGFAQVLLVDGLTARAHRRFVEGPELHPRHTHRFQAPDQLLGGSEKSDQVFVLPAFRYADLGFPVPVDVRRTPCVGRAGAGVVDADAIANLAAKELVDRAGRGLAQEIPQGDIDGRRAAHRDRGTRESDEVLMQGLVESRDRERILSQDPRRDRFMDEGFHRLHSHTGLSEADEPLVRMTLQKENAGKLSQPDCLETGYLHRHLHGGPVYRSRGSCLDPMGAHSLEMSLRAGATVSRPRR